MKQKRPPGPIGTSCLTCKRRRKKCDQGRPICERCADGGYDCLGYDHNRGRIIEDPGSNSSRAESVEGTDSSTQLQWLGSPEFASRHSPLASQGSNQSTDLSFTSPGSSYGAIASTSDFNVETYDRGISFSSLVAVANAGSLTSYRQRQSVPDTGSPFDANTPVSQLDTRYRRSDAPYSQTFLLLNPSLSPLTARYLSTLPPNVKNVVKFVLTQYERVLELVYFKPKDEHIDHIREVVINRLQASSITRHAVHLGARIIQSILDGTSSTNRATFNKALEQFEQTLCLISTQRPNSSEEITCRLNGFLEAAFIKMRLGNGYNAYNLLHGVAPIFLEMVFSDPSLWPSVDGPPAPSLAHVISSTRFELGHFALMDLTCAMVYGLPQVVPYDTSSPVVAVDRHPIEWVQCCPPEFQLCLAEINKRCANRYISHDWHLIERRLLAYKPFLSRTDGAESWRVVGRLAVIESWRQVLLTYLYMAVCGSASDDTRVQTAIRQIIQLFGTVRRQEPPKVNVHFIHQYLIVGICTRSEKQRAYVRERLADEFDNELWLLPGSEFVQVLDHLWHGAAANGKPIKWSDYIMSRQVTLPIPVSV